MSNGRGSEFDRSLTDFVFADVCIEASGMTLTVLSMLSRRDLDAWQEAKRLTMPSQANAVVSLAGTLADTASNRWTASQATEIAARLVRLLPVRTPSAASMIQGGNGPFIASRMMTLLPLRGGQLTRRTVAGRGLSQRIIRLALVAAVLVGFAANVAIHWDVSWRASASGLASSHTAEPRASSTGKGLRDGLSAHTTSIPTAREQAPL